MSFELNFFKETLGGSRPGIPGFRCGSFSSPTKNIRAHEEGATIYEVLYTMIHTTDDHTAFRVMQRALHAQAAREEGAGRNYHRVRQSLPPSPLPALFILCSLGELPVTPPRPEAEERVIHVPGVSPQQYHELPEILLCVAVGLGQQREAAFPF